MWKYDTEDADVDGTDITDNTVIRKYNNFIKTAESGAFDSVCMKLATYAMRITILNLF
jgi:hypothetical protein